MIINWELLKRLVETPAIPGREDAMRSLTREHMEGCVGECSTDVMGNLVGLRRGKGTCRVMLAAHMDEIGFMVKHVDDRGFLRLQPLGGFDPRQLFAQRVIVHSRKGGSLRGVLSYTTKPTHLLSDEERKEVPAIEKFFVDLGMPAEAVRNAVDVGDMVVMDRTLEESGETFIGKALDNRIGVFVMLEVLRNVGDLDADLYVVATVQEEVGLRGATTSSFTIEPDIGIAIDTTLANDFPGMQDHDKVTELGCGVAIKIMDASMISNPGLVEHMRDIAEREDIPFQMEILPRGGTDGGALQRSRGGNASITISIPARYIHTVNEMVHRKDVASAIRLLGAYLKEAGTRTYHP